MGKVLAFLVTKFLGRQVARLSRWQRWWEARSLGRITEDERQGRLLG